MNFIEKLKRKFIREKYRGNQELARRNMEHINAILAPEYLDKVESKEKALKELSNLKEHLLNHEKDYLAYFRDEYLNEEVEYRQKYIKTKMKRKDYIKNVALKEEYTGLKLAIGIPSFIIFTAAFLPLGLPISIFLANYIPKRREYVIKPRDAAIDRFAGVIDTIKEKIETIGIEETEHKSSLETLVSKFSLEVAEVMDLIDKYPYPNSQKEETDLLLLNREFLKEQKELIDEPETSIKLKLVYTDYNAKLEEIKNKILEKQKLHRSANVVKEEAEDFSIGLPYVPTTKPKKLMRYRVKN